MTGNLFIQTTTTAEHFVPQRGVDTRAIIINRKLVARCHFADMQLYLAIRPLAGVVQ